MTFRSNRKVTPKVVDGRVQKKQRHAVTPSIWNSETFVLEKERPGRGYKHLLSRADVVNFINIIPDWHRHAKGLKGVRLVEGGYDYDGLFFESGLIFIPAWERALWREVDDDFFQEHQALYDRLNIPYKKNKGYWLIKFSEETAKAYQLLHIFFHELGHHCDRMSTKTKFESARGENYADAWAFKYEALVWRDYLSTFLTN